MNKYLYNLAIEILRLHPGQSKVKFAKLIYFVHKELIRSRLVASTELSFVRMPLGPIPVGFMDLQSQEGILVSEIPTQLLYNSQVYEYGGSKDSELSPSKKGVISSVLKHLVLMSTTDIVDLSHKEDSWSKLGNGIEFTITNEDLKTTLPQIVKSKIEDERGLQEKLVDGMLSDIVASSTSLEYPEDER